MSMDLLYTESKSAWRSMFNLRQPRVRCVLYVSKDCDAPINSSTAKSDDVTGAMLGVWLFWQRECMYE